MFLGVELNFMKGCIRLRPLGYKGDCLKTHENTKELP